MKVSSILWRAEYRLWRLWAAIDIAADCFQDLEGTRRRVAQGSPEFRKLYTYRKEATLRRLINDAAEEFQRVQAARGWPLGKLEALTLRWFADNKTAQEVIRMTAELLEEMGD